MLIIDTRQLYGQHIYLELLLPEHAPVLSKLAKDERIWEFTKTILINDQYDDQFQSYINAALNPDIKDFVQGFVVRQTSNKEIIGSTRYYEIDQKYKRLNIGYTWYVPSVWGKVHNKECKLLLLQYAFEVLHFRRVGFEVAHQNIRSQKAVEKIGGVKEGILRNHGIRGDGSSRDTIIFSIIEKEWPDIKMRLAKFIEET